MSLEMEHFELDIYSIVNLDYLYTQIVHLLGEITLDNQSRA